MNQLTIDELLEGIYKYRRLAVACQDMLAVHIANKKIVMYSLALIKLLRSK